MNAWSHLPNAQYIDRVLESVKSHPEIWTVTRDAAWDAALIAAWDASWDADRGVSADVAWDEALDAAWDVAQNADRGVSTDADRDAYWNAASAARSAALALIAYDDAVKYLDMTSDKLRVWYILSETPAAILLLPAVLAFERLNELECV